jgi:DNA primase small subunit
MIKIEYLTPATPEERKRYYKEEWNIKQVPDFISNTIQEREFGFDHVGRGPNDRYKIFRTPDFLRRFLKVRTPFAAYSSVAFYNKPQRRDGWNGAELVFDVDAKDIPVRTCECEGVCEICLNEAREIVCGLIDVLKGDLGLKNIHIVYSGRGYHLRVLDPSVLKTDSDVRSQIVKYLVGADMPENEFSLDFERVSYEHFVVPFGYPKVFTDRVKFSLLHLNKNSKLDDVNKKLLNDVLKYRNLIENNQWGIFKGKIGPQRYKKVVSGIAALNMSLVDAKVSIDLKRILRLPSSLHSMVSMKCTEVKNIETFDPFKEAVPKFVYERK